MHSWPNTVHNPLWIWVRGTIFLRICSLSTLKWNLGSHLWPLFRVAANCYVAEEISRCYVACGGISVLRSEISCPELEFSLNWSRSETVVSCVFVFAIVFVYYGVLLTGILFFLFSSSNGGFPHSFWVVSEYLQCFIAGILMSETCSASAAKTIGRHY